jgi:hypothetical protein
MTLGARVSVEKRSQAVGWVVYTFELQLIRSKGISGRLSQTVTDCLRSRALRLWRRGKTCWGFRGGLLSDKRQARD